MENGRLHQVSYVTVDLHQFNVAGEADAKAVESPRQLSVNGYKMDPWLTEVDMVTGDPFSPHAYILSPVTTSKQAPGLHLIGYHPT